MMEEFFVFRSEAVRLSYEVFVFVKVLELDRTGGEGVYRWRW